jgi:transcriptional regulator with XRE-family HTH domain
MHIGKSIRELRKKAGLTQADLAKTLGVKQQVIASYEKGLANPEVAKLPALAKALGISIAELFQEGAHEEAGQKIRRKNSRDIQAQEVFRKLKPEEQRTILKHMRALAHVH